MEEIHEMIMDAAKIRIKLQSMGDIAKSKFILFITILELNSFDIEKHCQPQ